MPMRARLENSTVQIGDFFILAGEFFLQPETAHRAEIAFDVNSQHLFKFFSQVARYQVQRLFEHRAAFDGVDRLAFFQSPVQLFDQRAFSGTDGAHEIEHLAAFLALERRGVKVAHDLGDGFFDAEELVSEEVVDFDGFVFVEPLDVGIGAFLNVADTGFHDDCRRAGRGLAWRWMGSSLTFSR